MKILLLQDVKNVGRRFDVKNVPDGFARNFLIIRKLAEPYTDAAEKKVSKLREEAARTEAKTKEEYKIIADILRGKTLTIKGKANKEGHLFASIKEADIAKELGKEHNVSISGNHIKLEAPIKNIGEQKIPILLGEDKVEVTLKVEEE